MLETTPTERFSSRVGNYSRFRPSYPAEVLDILKQECGLASDSTIADIASGTGIFTRMLLKNGNRVYGIEPNDAMRQAGHENLANYSKFTSIAGTAENTGLANASVDLVTAAQAAHWFDRDKAIAEFRRILKAGGYLALVWNDRRIHGTQFSEDYEDLLLKYGTDYAEVKRRDNAAQDFFGEIRHQKRVLRNFQDFDYAALEGRLLSSSYTPATGHPRHQAMLAELQQIFDRHQQGGAVRMEYDTNLYFGQL